MSKDIDEFLTTEEAMKFLNTSRQTINRLAREGKLQQYKQGYTRTVYYKKADLINLKFIRPVDKFEED